MEKSDNKIKLYLSSIKTCYIIELYVEIQNLIFFYMQISIYLLN